jgi:hypothetical protein
VADAIRAALSPIEAPWVGISSLAVGADQLFASLALELGGELRVVLPFPTYAETFAPGKDLDGYRDLLARARAIEVLPATASREQSYLAAGQRVVDLSDWMIAVWNGKQAAGLGGTGDIVRYAVEGDKRVLHIDPTTKGVTQYS